MADSVFENLDSPTVLLVENDRNGRRLLCEILTGMGIKAIASGDGTEALDRCAQHAGGIDLLVTDLILPGMHGLELSKRVRVLHPNIKVLFISGFTEFAARQFGFELDGPLLEKPISTTALRARVADILQTTHSAA